jgi:hypothetical protein
MYNPFLDRKRHCFDRPGVGRAWTCKWQGTCYHCQTTKPNADYGIKRGKPYVIGESSKRVWLYQ